MLTRKQHELVCFIYDRLSETGVSPAFEEMKDALDKLRRIYSQAEHMAITVLPRGVLAGQLAG